MYYKCLKNKKNTMLDLSSNFSSSISPVTTPVPTTLAKRSLTIKINEQSPPSKKKKTSLGIEVLELSSMGLSSKIDYLSDLLELADFETVVLISNWIGRHLAETDEESLIKYLLHYQLKIFKEHTVILEGFKNWNGLCHLFIRFFEKYVNLREDILDITWFIASYVSRENVKDILDQIKNYCHAFDRPTYSKFLKIENYYFLIQNSEIPHENFSSQSFAELKILGSGGNGVVRRFEKDSVAYALKSLKPNHRDNINSFLQEMRIHSSLKHSNIIELYSINLDFSCLSYLMELAPLGTLTEQLHLKGSTWTVSRIIEVALGVATGLEYIHSQNILHGDLKTQNILISSSGVAKLADFGCAHHLDFEVLSLLSLNGTQKFFAPEVLLREASFTLSRDIYAFAYVLWELWTKKIPFQNYLEFRLCAHVILGGRESLPEKDFPLKSLITSCWAQNFRERPCAADVVQLLRSVPDVDEVRASTGFVSDTSSRISEGTDPESLRSLSSGALNLS